jgi:hypothetical protein
MSIEASDGPVVSIGLESPIGTTAPLNNAPGAMAYVSGASQNPDAGPSVIYAGALFKDMRYRYGGGKSALVAGGYPNQVVGYVDNALQTIDLVPSAVSNVNIAALSAPSANTPLALVNVSGAGITVLAAAFNVLATGLIVPVGALQIDAAPAWFGYGTSGAVQGWTGAACGRAVSLTSLGNLSAINFTIRGFDLYGLPQTETLAGPNGNTVNGKKGWKWITSVTPNGSSATTVSVGTADVFEFPIRADRFGKVGIVWNNSWFTNSVGFVAADTTSPASATTGSVRGTFTLQGDTSNGVKSMQVEQGVPPALVGTQVGVFGVTPA